MSESITFEALPVGSIFFDPSTGEDFHKVCANAAEFITGGDYFTGNLATFNPLEIVEINTKQQNQEAAAKAQQTQPEPTK